MKLQSTNWPAWVGGLFLGMLSSLGQIADLVGQEAMVRTLKNAFTADRIAQAFIMTGIRGTGKTTTARMLAHIFKLAGHHVGLTTTDGVYIDGQLSVKGDMTGPVSAQMILRDPTIDAAVLEELEMRLITADVGVETTERILSGLRKQVERALAEGCAADDVDRHGSGPLHYAAIAVEREDGTPKDTAATLSRLLDAGQRVQCRPQPRVVAGCEPALHGHGSLRRGERFVELPQGLQRRRQRGAAVDDLVAVAGVQRLHHRQGRPGHHRDVAIDEQ